MKKNNLRLLLITSILFVNTNIFSVTPDEVKKRLLERGWQVRTEQEEAFEKAVENKIKALTKAAHKNIKVDTLVQVFEGDTTFVDKIAPEEQAGSEVELEIPPPPGEGPAPIEPEPQPAKPKLQPKDISTPGGELEALTQALSSLSGPKKSLTPPVKKPTTSEKPPIQLPPGAEPVVKDPKLKELREYMEDPTKHPEGKTYTFAKDVFYFQKDKPAGQGNLKAYFEKEGITTVEAKFKELETQKWIKEKTSKDIKISTQPAKEISKTVPKITLSTKLSEINLTSDQITNNSIVNNIATLCTSIKPFNMLGFNTMKKADQNQTLEAWLKAQGYR